MKYSFYKKEVDTTKSVYYLAKVEESTLKALSILEFKNSTYHEIDDLMNGVISTINSDNKYEYQLEDDLYIVSDKDGILFFDLTPLVLGQKEIKKEDLKLTHEEFLNFLKDFKRFIEENK